MSKRPRAAVKNSFWGPLRKHVTFCFRLGLGRVLQTAQRVAPLWLRIKHSVRSSTFLILTTASLFAHTSFPPLAPHIATAASHYIPFY